jgi:hypothetical protein
MVSGWTEFNAASGLIPVGARKVLINVLTATRTPVSARPKFTVASPNHKAATGLRDTDSGSHVSTLVGTAQPPNPADLQTWYDGSDITTLFSNDTGTTPISGADAGVVRGWRSKGSVPLLMKTGPADTDVEFDTPFQNSLGGVFSSGAGSFKINGVLTEPVGGPGEGWTMAWVGDVKDIATAQDFLAGVRHVDSAFITSFAVDNSPAGEIQWVIDGDVQNIAGATVANGEVWAGIMTFDAAQLGTVRVSKAAGLGTHTFATAAQVQDGFRVGSDFVSGAQNDAGGMTTGTLMFWRGVQDIPTIEAHITSKWGITWA